MRILTVSNFFASHCGGIEIVAGMQCKQFGALGHEPVWAASGLADSNDKAATEVVELSCFDPTERLTGLPLPIPSLAAMWRLWKTVSGSDAVVVHDALNPASIIAMIAAICKGKPTILVQHIRAIPFQNICLRITMAVANALVIKPMLKSAGQVVFISATTRQAFETVVMKRPPLLLFNGIDEKIFHWDEPNDGSAARLALGLPANKEVALFVGRFVQKKGLSILLQLAKSRPDIHFVFAGWGPIDPNSWGLDNITVFRGFTGPAIAQLYHVADVLILPSVGEGYPLVIQEAMACGLPIICGEDSSAADPGARRWLKGVSVTFARPIESARAASAAIDILDMSQQERIAMANYAIHTYRWENMALRIVNALKVQQKLDGQTL